MSKREDVEIEYSVKVRLPQSALTSHNVSGFHQVMQGISGGYSLPPQVPAELPPVVQQASLLLPESAPSVMPELIQHSEPVTHSSSLAIPEWQSPLPPRNNQKAIEAIKVGALLGTSIVVVVGLIMFRAEVSGFVSSIAQKETAFTSSNVLPVDLPSEPELCVGDDGVKYPHYDIRCPEKKAQAEQKENGGKPSSIADLLEQKPALGQ